MFDSNFPVDRLMSSDSQLRAAYSDITCCFSDDERHALFCGNTERVYRI
ncbi:MAG: hypothetical protein JRF56_15165 [Deltaproteobacteria bacterium]|nr:hypothetical protein [Deltaproteobacteria bacterium]